MARSRIPVDLFNPGQVFACMGFLEAAEALLGGAEAGFDWSDPADTRFVLSAAGDAEPVAEVLDFLVRAELRRFAPDGYRDPPPKRKAKKADDDAEAGDADEQAEPPETAPAFPAPEPDRMTLPVRFRHGNLPPIALTHWADGSGRDPFKLYSGNRSAFTIAGKMLLGLRELYGEQREALIAAPFGVMAPMGGSFNFDPRGAWTAIDAGYSLNDQKPKHLVLASHVVELLAAWGLEHARPTETGLRRYRYAAWQTSLAPALARPAFAGALEMFPQRHFVVNLHMSGKNKVMAFAEEETGL